MTTGGVGVHVKGAKELRKTLKQAGVDMKDLRDVHARVAAVVANAATPPKGKTGRLAGSVRPSGQVGRAVIRAGGAKVPYAQPIHWGWPARGITATLFITEPAADTEPQWYAMYVDGVQAICDTVKGDT